MKLLHSVCYGLNDCVSPNSLAEGLILDMIVFADGTFGQELGLFRYSHEGWDPHNSISGDSSKRKHQVVLSLSRCCSLSLSPSLYLSLPCESTVRRQLSVNQQEGPHQNLTNAVILSQTSRFQDCEKLMSAV